MNINEKEKTLLGGLLDEPQKIQLCLSLSENDFLDYTHKKIFNVIKESVLKNCGIIDYINTNLDKNTTIYCLEIMRYLTDVSFKELVREVKEESIKRKIKSNLTAISSDIDKQPINKTKKQINDALSCISGLSIDKKTNKDIVMEIFENKVNGRVRGLNTGIKAIDDITIGLKKKHNWVIGAYTNTGKTFFAIEIMLNLIQAGHKVLFITLEMPRDEIIERMWYKLNQRNMIEGDILDFLAYNQNYEIIDNLYTISDIETFVSIKQDKPDVVFIDFLQLISSTEKGNEYERMTDIARRIQSLAKKEDVCIVSLSQINEESQKSKLSTLGFKGSGDIGNAASVGIRLTIEDNENEIVPFIVAIKKNRHGRKAVLNYEFDKKRNKFIF